MKLKVLIAKALTCSIVGRIIALIYRDKISFWNTYILTKSKEITPSVKALLFWKLYESAEVRFVNKWLQKEEFKYLDVIELGSSIGAIACQIAKFSKGKIVCLEANPNLIDTIQSNLKFNSVKNYVVVNKAIALNEGSKKIHFSVGHSNHVSKISEDGEGIEVDTVTISKLIKNHSIGKFILVSDIEGAEIGFLQNDPQSLSNCQLLIIETHQVDYEGKTYAPADIKRLIENLGFEIVESYGPNYVFVRI